MSLTFTEKQRVKDLICITHVRGTDGDGNPVYAYFAISACQLENMVKELSEKGSVNPKNYGGMMIHKGQGIPPSELDPQVKATGYREDGVWFALKE